MVTHDHTLVYSVPDTLTVKHPGRDPQAYTLPPIVSSRVVTNPNTPDPNQTHSLPAALALVYLTPAGTKDWRAALMAVVEGSGFVPRSWLASFQDITSVLPLRELCTQRLALVAEMPAVALGSTQVHSPAPSTSGSVVAWGLKDWANPVIHAPSLGLQGARSRSLQRRILGLVLTGSGRGELSSWSPILFLLSSFSPPLFLPTPPSDHNCLAVTHSNSPTQVFGYPLCYGALWHSTPSFTSQTCGLKDGATRLGS